MLGRAVIVVALFGIPALAGCAETSVDSPGDAPATVAALSFGNPIAALDCDPCFEPTIAADPTGRIFIANGDAAAGSVVAVSEDDGATWETHPTPPLPIYAAGPLGNQQDALVQVAPSGRLYWSALVFSSVYDYTAIQIAWSDDGAKTWAGNVFLSAIDGTPEVVRPDRQWLGFAPDGSLVLTYNQIPTGIWFARSRDGGATWADWVRAIPFESRTGEGTSGPPVVDVSGAIHIPACAREALLNDVGGSPGLSPALVYNSYDDGKTFQVTTTELACDFFPTLAVAADGTIVLTTRRDDVSVARSTDGGRTFSSPQTWGAPAVSSTWPVVRVDGGLDIIWFAVHGAAADVVVTRGTIDDGPSETVTIGQVTPASSAVPSVDPESRLALTHFAHGTRLPDGRLAVVWVNGADARIMVGFETATL